MAIDINIEQHLACFQVKEMLTFDHEPKTHKERYWIKVSFEKDSAGNEKVAAFHCKSQSLKNCFEMIEAFGQQCKGMQSQEFNEFMQTTAGKEMFFAMHEDPK